VSIVAKGTRMCVPLANGSTSTETKGARTRTPPARPTTTSWAFAFSAKKIATSINTNKLGKLLSTSLAGRDIDFVTSLIALAFFAALFFLHSSFRLASPSKPEISPLHSQHPASKIRLVRIHD
jgi:hypothetical protein